LDALAVDCRLAQAPELAEAAAVICQSFYPLDSVLGLVAPLLQWGIEQDLRQRQRQNLAGYGCFISTHRETGQILGVVEVELKILSRQSPYRMGQPQPYLSNLAVHPDYRQQGLGQRLIQTVETWVKQQGHVHIYLHVLAQNQAALRLYRQLGYQLRVTDEHWLFPTRLLLFKIL
jgi:ribosomal protein S18 acetylase RimI-like enzyme